MARELPPTPPATTRTSPTSRASEAVSPTPIVRMPSPTATAVTTAAAPQQKSTAIFTARRTPAWRSPPASARTAAEAPGLLPGPAPAGMAQPLAERAHGGGEGPDGPEESLGDMVQLEAGRSHCCPGLGGGGRGGGAWPPRAGIPA